MVAPLVPPILALRAPACDLVLLDKIKLVNPETQEEVDEDDNELFNDRHDEPYRYISIDRVEGLAVQRNY